MHDLVDELVRSATTAATAYQMPPTVAVACYAHLDRCTKDVKAALTSAPTPPTENGHE